MEEAIWAKSDNLKLQHQFEELQQRASIDALSGLLNRDTLEQCIKEQLEKMAPEDTCALFIIDLDDFKQVNDTLGHQAGDQAIHQSAQILSSLFRSTDIIGRLGGDEFAVFLWGRITEDLARRKGTEICKTLQLVLGTYPVVNITASVGIYLADAGQQFDGMYQSADLALYKAKKAGKHGFCLKSHDSFQEESGSNFLPVNTIPLSGLLECMDSGVALLEMGEYPRVIYVSPSFCRILGVDSQTYPVPISLSSLIHPDDQAEFEKALRNGLQQGCAVEYTHRISADGNHRWLWWHVRAVRIAYDNPNPVMLVTTTDISQFKESESRLEEVNQRLQAAFDQTSQRIWEVNIPAGTFNVFGRDGMSRTLEYDNIDFPEQLIDDGRIHPNSVSRFREFAAELLSGQSRGCGNFILQNQDTGSYSWFALSYRMLYDEIGRAVKAVGVIEDLPQSFSEQNSAGSFHRSLPDSMLSDLMVWMRANLTLDSVEELWVEGKNLESQVRKTSCSQILQQEREKVCRKDAESFIEEAYDRQKLLTLFSEGIQWLAAEYQRADGGGNIRWVRHVLYLAQNPLSNDVYLFVYLIRTDLHRKWERAIQQEAIRDPISQLYNPDTVLQIGRAMFQSHEGGSCAVALLQMNGLAANQSDNGLKVAQIRGDIAIALSVALGGSCILGQYDANHLLLLFPSVSSRGEISRHIEEAVSFVRQILKNAPYLNSLRFITGVAIQSADMANFSVLLSQAAHICEQWWNAGSDTVAFSHEDDDWSWTQLQTHEKSDRVAIHSEEMKRPLSELEKDVAFHCMSAMLSADSLEASVQNVLKTIGTYYHADRVYILMLAKKHQVITMPFEWTSSNKSSIRQAVSGMRLSRFPLLKRCVEERAPIFLTRTQPLRVQNEMTADHPWYFTTFPLIRQEQLEGFLCIENSREHPADAALFSTLIPYMLRERDRFHGINPNIGAVERLMELPNLRSYMETIYTLNSDRFSSLGVVFLDIPSMAAINSSLGFEYGSKLLWYVCKTLTDLFGASLLFRTWETEFVAFCPNTTRQVFLGRCNRLYSILQRRYPKETRIGYAWADGFFAGKYLADEARNVMRTKQTGSVFIPQAFLLAQSDYVSVTEAIRAGRFTIYFQPQINMRTSCLYGAEILVRGVRDDGSIISPAQFISILEENGSIRELDLFVLERTLSQMEQWRASGIRLFPVSVNLSRVTLLHPSTLASVLAIQSRYPNIPADAVELEITESAGSIEASEFREIVNRFRSCGLKISLDDFGSQYANLPLFTSVKFDTVKLDRGLIAELASNPINQMLIRDIVQISKACDMICIAEGVETQGQIAALLEAGCIYAQGYYYDSPLSAEQFMQKYLLSQTPELPIGSGANT